MLEAIMNSDYKQMVERFEKEENKKDGIVFLGDSLINYLDTKKYFKTEIINRGIAGDTTIGVLKRLEQIYKLNPKIVVLNIGSNDIVRLSSNSKESIVKRILEIKYLLETNIPNVKVYVVSLTPVLDNNNKISKKLYIQNRTNEDINNINEEINVFTKTIDISSLLMDDNGNLDFKYTYDGIHLNDLGYHVYCKILSENIEELTIK